MKKFAISFSLLMVGKSEIGVKLGGRFLKVVYPIIPSGSGRFFGYVPRCLNPGLV